MAIFHLSKLIIGGKAGGSAVMASGYSHGRKVTQDLNQQSKSYEFKRVEVVHEAILLPDGAPDWAVARYIDRDVGAASERLWNDVEKREQRSTQKKTAQQAHFYNISLPVELSRRAQIKLIEDFARASLTSNGEIADITIHDMGNGNPHAHVMQTMRPLGAEGFDNKIRNFKTARLELINLRAAWASAANKALEMEGHEARIDHRSNVDRGLDLAPGTNFHATIAASIEQDGGVYRGKIRSQEARAKNEQLLMENPDHILMVLSQEKPRFVAEDLEFELRRKLPPEVEPGVVRSLVLSALASPELIVLEEKDYRGQPIYTTRTALEMGRSLTRSTLQMRDSAVDLGQAEPSPEPDPDLDLSDEQANAYRAMISPRRIEVIEGFAGTGKTRTLIEASKVWEDRGFAVYGSAISGKAVQELSDLKGHKGTIAHFEQVWEAGALPPEGKFVMFMDEASMVGVSTWARFQHRINEMGGIIRIIGDRAQTTPVNDASALEHVASLTGVTSITEIRRQQGDAATRGDRVAIQAISKGISGIAPALEHFEKVNCVTISDDAAISQNKIVESFFEGSTPDQFWTKGHQRLAIAHTNADVDSLNRALHQKALQLGFASKRKEDSITISRAGDEKDRITLSKGDRIRFTQAYSDLGISKNSLGRINWVSGAMMGVAIDGRPGLVEIDTAKVSTFEYGYAVTIHKSQGASIDGKVFAMLTKMVDWHLLDVLVSRHILDIDIHVPAADFDRSFPSDIIGTDQEGPYRKAVLDEVIKRVSRSGLSKVISANVAPTLRRAHPTLDEVLGHVRADRLAHVTQGPSDIATLRVNLVNDTHLFQISQRTAGLMRSEFEEGKEPEFKSDPRGYIVDPMKVVDDLLAQTGTVRASAVAGRLSEVTGDPTSFSQLFYRAMEHPDLVILSEGGIAGEGRVYSTVAHIDQATSLMDQALRLAVRQVAFHVPEIEQQVPNDPVDPSEPFLGGLPTSEDAAPSLDLEAVRSASLDAKLTQVIQDRALDDEGAAAIRTVLWPARIGVIESIGSHHTTQIIAAASDVVGKDHIIAVHPSRVIAEKTAATLGGAGYTLHGLGAELKEGQLSLGAGDILYVPDASGLGIDHIEILMGHAEATGAKLVLHRDPTIEETGAVLRHIADRLPVAQVGGLSSIDPQLQGLVQGDDALDQSIKGLWDADRLTGAQSEKQQVVEYINAYFDHDFSQIVGLASSRKMRAHLNHEIEMARHENAHGSTQAPVSIDRAAFGPPLNMSVGTRLVLNRDVPPHRLVAGDRGTVIGFTDYGAPILRCDRAEVGDSAFMPGLEAAALDYGYVVAPQMALRTDMKAQEFALFATRGLRKKDLLASLQLEGRLSVSLPAEVNHMGVSKAFFERVMARQPSGSILDYGFDPSKALLAAADAFQAPSLEARLDISAENKAILDETQMVYRTNPALIIADLTRRRGRFQLDDLTLELRRYYSGTELDAPDRLDLAHKLIDAFEADGTIIRVGFSDVDGSQSYTTRVQGEIEMKAIETGRALGAKSLPNVAPFISDDARLAHVTGANRLSLAMLPASAAQQHAFYQDLGRVWRDRGYKIIATDMSKVSSQEHAQLMGDDVEFASWTSLDTNWAMGRVPASGEKTVLVISDAETMPANQYARIQAKADQLGMKIIALAGEHDLPRNSSVSMFKVLSGEIGVYRETPTLIQNREADRIALTLMAGTPDDAARAVAIFDSLGHIHFAGARTSAMQSIARRYWADGPASDVSRLAFTHSRANADTLDSIIRAEGQRLGYLGEEVSFYDTWKANIGQQINLTHTLMPGLNDGDCVQLTNATTDGIMVFSPVTSSTHFIPKEKLGDAQPSFARTLWDATKTEVDKSFVLATYGMDQSLFKLALSRHRDDVEIHAANRDFQSLRQMQIAAGQRHDFVALKAGLKPTERSVVQDHDLDGRRDRNAPIFKAGVYAQDVHLQAVAQRVSSLLEIGYDPSAPIVADDPNGYATEPRKVIDDILAQSSVLRADDVASRLSRAVRDPKTFERLFADAMMHPELVILSEDGRNGEGRVYSTLAQIKLEMSLHDRITALSLTENALSVPDKAYAQVAVTDHGPMTRDQEQALRHVTSGARISVVNGVAGSGKSTLFAGVRDLYEQAGWQVIGTALTGEATRTLAETSGINSRTVASLLGAAETGKLSIGPKTALVIDRAGLLDARTYEAVISLVEKSGASLMLADTSEHIQYGAGGMFRQIANTLGATTLGESMRQSDPRDAKAVQDLARGGDGIAGVVADFDQRGMIVGTGRDRDLSLRTIVNAFTVDQSDDKIMIALRRADVDELNHLARAADQSTRDPALVDQPVTDSNGNTISLQTGDKIRIAVSSHSQGVYKGELGDVVHVNPQAETFTLKMGKGDESRYVSLPFEGGPSLTYAYAQTIDTATGAGHQSVHAVLDNAMGRDRGLAALGLHTNRLAIYTPTDQDEAASLVTRIASRRTQRATTLEREYGFDPRRSGEAIQVARSNQMRLADYLEANEVPSSRPARSKIADFFSPDSASEGLAPAAPTRALAHVRDGRAVEGEMVLDGTVQHQITRLLQDVSDKKTWARMFSRLSRAERSSIDLHARRWTGATENEVLLPEARALARAIAYSDNRGTHEITRNLKSGMQALAFSVEDARQSGKYEQMLKEAYAPVIDTRQLAPVGVSQGPAYYGAQPDPYRSAIPRDRSIFAEIKEISEREYARAKLKADAAILAREEAAKEKERVPEASTPSVAHDPEHSFTATKGMTPMDYLDEDHSEPATSGHKDVWERYALDETVRDSRYKIRDMELFRNAEKDSPDWTGPYTKDLVQRQGPVPAKDIDRYMSKVGKDAPKAWVERHRERLLTLGTSKPSPEFKSKAEFTWAMSYTAEQNVLQPEGLDLDLLDGEGKGVQQHNWFSRNLRHNVAKTGEIRQGFVSEELAWMAKVSRYLERTEFVPRSNIKLNMAEIGEEFEKRGIPELEKENVPAEWKDRLTQIIANRHTDDAQPAVKSPEEFIWAARFMASVGASRSLGRAPEPKDIAPKLSGPDVGLDPW